jgi:hypothetical protein
VRNVQCAQEGYIEHLCRVSKLCSMRPMRLLSVLALGVLLLSCGGSEDGPCQPRSGLYRMHLVANGGGNCGPIPDLVVSSSGMGGDPACVLSTMSSADGCMVSLEGTCPASDNSGGKVTTRTSVTWTKDGHSASGTMYLELRSAAGAVQCVGTYALTMTSV